MPDDRDQGSWENATPELRFVERTISVPLPQGYSELRTVKILQQRWDIYENGLPAVARSEWRDVPLVTEG